MALESWYESFEYEQADSRQRRGYQLLTGDSKHSDQACVIPAEIQSLIDDVGKFTTAVFVDFEDDVWRTLYNALSSEEQRLPGNNNADRLRSQAWFDETTANESNSSQITPELLLNLRGIDRLVVEDNRGDDLPRVQRWNVFGRKRTRDAQTTTDNAFRFDTDAEGAEESVKAWEVSAELESGGTEDQPEGPLYEFLNVSFKKGRTYEDWRDRFDVETGDQEEQSMGEVPVSLLIKRTPDYGRSYHPHLYYPISRSDSGRQFPFCIHGDFVVQQGRQSLSGSDLQRNCIVTAEAARLVGRLGEVLVEQEQWADLHAATPWCLLPDATELTSTGFDESSNYAAEIASQSAQEIGNNAPFDALRADIYWELRQRQCLQVKVGDEEATRRPIDDDPVPLVHSNPVVMGAVAALYVLTDTGTDNPDALCSASIHGAEQVPTQTTLLAFSKWLTIGQQTGNDGPFSVLFDQLSEATLEGIIDDRKWTNRVQRLKTLSNGHHSDNSDDEESGTIDGSLFEAWTTVLHDWAETLPENVDEVIPNVKRNVAHALLEGTLALADDTADLNGLTRDNGSSPHLLPCIPTGDDETLDESPDTAQLVTVENHQTEGKAAASDSEFQRQVLRPDSNQAVTPPGEDVQFNIFYLTQRACLDAVAEADWGTRQYAGDTDLYRTLLKDIGDRIDVVTREDIEYLATRYDDASPEKNALKPTEGSYHDFDDLSTMVSQGSDASDVMQIRNRVRRRAITSNLLTSGDSIEARTLRLSSSGLSEWLTDEEDEDQDITTAVTTIESGFEVPAITDDPSVELSVNQLSLLGVSVLPHVRVITSVTDQAHPTGYQWNPHGWTNWKRGIDEIPDRAIELQDLLATSGNELHYYLKAISTPPFGPGVSADHSSKCDVKEYPSENDLLHELSDNSVRLASWVWLESNALAGITGEVLESLLELSGPKFADSILVTGWVCDEDHGPKNIDESIPTVLNWQLRSIPGTGISGFETPKPDADSEPWPIRFAVLEDRDRAAVNEWLPRITDTGDIPERVWETIGVKDLEDLNATEAALRLNELMDRRFDDTSQPELSDRSYGDRDGWRTLYAKLLAPIAAAVDEFGDDMMLEHLQFLNRFPVVQVDNETATWIAPTLEELRGKCRYYDQEERTWEDRIQSLSNSEYQYLISRPDSQYVSGDAFEALCEDLEANVEPVARPVITGPEEKFKKNENDDWQQQLQNEVNYAILAAAPGDPEDRVERFDTAVDSLQAYTEKHPKWGFKPLKDNYGVKLENVENSDAASYAPTYSSQEITELPELAILFQALFNGGSIDSYRLALSGGTVEGLAETKQRLREDSYHELPTDVEFAATLLEISIDHNELEAAFAIEDTDSTDAQITDVSTIRTELANTLQNNPLEQELPDEVVKIADTLQAATADAHPEICNWISNRLRPGSTLTDPSTWNPWDKVPPTADSVPDWQDVLLERIAEQPDLPIQVPDLLPRDAPNNQVARLREAMRHFDGDPDEDLTDLSNYPGIKWRNTVTGEAPDEVDVELPDGYTWFHLVVWAASEDVWIDADPIPILLSELTPGDATTTLESYITNGPPATRTASETTQDRDLETQLTDLEDAIESISDNIDSSADFKATSRGSAGGYTGSTTKRPRVAELTVLRKSYHHLIDDDIDRETLEADLHVLEADANYWHTNAGWEDTTQHRHSDAELPNQKDELSGTLPGEAFDVTDERGPGYDILDPAGWALRNPSSKPDTPYTYPNATHLTPVPIEVKSVTDPDDPTFRFSVNQFRRALDFVTASNDDGRSIPYVILLLTIEQPDEDTFYASICGRRILRDREDVYDLLPDSVIGDETDSAERQVVHDLLTDLLRGGKFVIS